jgi:hypothetical protein
MFINNATLFNNIFNDVLQSLHKVEIYAGTGTERCPLIFRQNPANRRMSTEGQEKDILNYVKINLADHILINKLNVNIIDRTKIIYWIGMYVYEKLNHPLGIKFLQALIIDDIYQDCNIEVDPVMCDKANDLANEGQDIFFKYYGRLGLYYSLKHIHRTVGNL